MTNPAQNRGRTGPTIEVDVRGVGWRKWVLIVHWVLMFVGTHWPEIERYKPDEGWPIPHFAETVHLGLYTIWGALWWWVLERRSGGGVHASSLWWVVAGGVAYACFDELTQLLVGRGGKLHDVAVDAIGVCLGVWVLQGAHRLITVGRVDRPA